MYICKYTHTHTHTRVRTHTHMLTSLEPSSEEVQGSHMVPPLSPQVLEELESSLVLEGLAFLVVLVQFLGLEALQVTLL